jgi:hypothetical protein
MASRTRRSRPGSSTIVGSCSVTFQLFADLPTVKSQIRYDARVVAVTRLGLDRVRTAGRDTTPFLIRLATGDDILARAVIDASGTWDTPNVLGASGIPAHGETGAAPLLEHALPDILGADRDRFAGKRVLVVGAGCSGRALHLGALGQARSTRVWSTADGMARALGCKPSGVRREPAPQRAGRGRRDGF